MGFLPISIECLADPSCGGSLPVDAGVRNEDGSPTKVDPATVASRLKELFSAIRTREVRSGGGRVEPVGAVVNYNITLTGFLGHRVQVRWSLRRAGSGAQVPLEWLKDRPFRWLKGEAEKDSASDSLWVPLPDFQGRFFVRLAVYDEDGVRLDYADTSPFR
jgi:hypothetical protein